VPREGHTGVEYSPHRRVQTGRVARVVQRVRERTVVRAYQAGSFAIGHTSTRISEPAARALFLGGYLGWAAKRHIVESNIGHLLGVPTGSAEVKRLARRTYSSYARFSLELMRLPWRPVDEPMRLLPPVGQAHATFTELWARCQAQDRAIVVVSGHIGSIEIFAGSYALQGIPTWGIADDTAYPELFALLNAQRARWGVSIIPWRNMREVFRVLRHSAVLGMVVDWGYRSEDVPVRLFGAWTTLPAGPATLAARTGALILPVAAYKQADGRYRAAIAVPIEVGDASPRSTAIATQAIADALESFVRAAPEQWHTFKPMWPATDVEARVLEQRAMAMLADAGRPRPSQPPTP
jgi:phosphatidylinositol dimannoside acyltransferase